jgi:hypothetical protein
VQWRKTYFGSKHQLTVLAMENLAFTLEKLGEVTETEKLFSQVDELKDMI